jgi:hypothetical protein
MRRRTPAVAGVFYPHDERELAARVDRLLEEGAARLGRRAQRPTADGAVSSALIAPHAGYDYSGPSAGTAFATLLARRAAFERVVLVGPAHWVGFHGIAVSTAAAFETPLGSVPVAVEVVERLLRLPGVAVNDAAHEPEHALEVELPFLQRTLGDFELVPWITGAVEHAAAVQVLAASIEGAHSVLVVVSSDLSHYLDAPAARAADAETARDIEAGRHLRGVQACGAAGVNALNALLEGGRHLETLDLRNSSDTCGSPERVVGYGAFGLA